MAEEVEIDQKVYDELIASGKSERIARSKAKAAAMRAKKAASGEKLGPRSAEELAAMQAGAGQGGKAKAGTAVATQERPGGGGAPGVLTPEERQARVAAALKAKGAGGEPRTGGTAGRAPTSTRYAGQDHTHRLLAMVPPSGIQQIRGKQDDKVYTWPHLLSSEFIALLAVTAFLTLFSTFAPAPLRELANPSVTPNPSKAPWYFLGLQEMLRYFHPMVAGVTVPSVGLLGLMMFPYLDKNPSVKPDHRKMAYALFTMFFVASAVLTIVGSFFRGPGFNFVWPWVDHLFFDL